MLLSRFRKNQLRILYASDLHGNEGHYELFFRLARKIAPTIIILGGDNAPKTAAQRTPTKQFDFYRQYFIPAVARFQSEMLRSGLKADIFLIYGNDDFRSYAGLLEQDLRSLQVTVLLNGVAKVGSNHALIGYSFVPITPFKYKDWEKQDVAGIERIGAEQGFTSYNEKLYPVNEQEISARGSILEDLTERFLEVGTYRRAILVSHAPPANTALDLSISGHVGSLAVRQTIERFQPVVSLHGHIHEAFELSGTFYEKIGPRTISANPGHFFDRPNLNAIAVELDPFVISRYTVTPDFVASALVVRPHVGERTQKIEGILQGPY